ncbi:c-type heme family protein [Flavobacterium sp.]|uniref:c-type heme family protein n=1 Tax=Flavobacterium sp. TaxID=239 RepID=UPI004048D8B3
MNKYSIGLFALLFFISCQKKNVPYEEITSLSEAYSPQEAKDLMETHCYLCHSPSTKENEGRIAPPMIAVKSRYLMDYNSKDDFVKAISNFVENPTNETAKMHGAVKKFGVMPKQVFPEKAVAQIANFMFDYQIDEPTWFKEHWQGHGNDDWTQPGKKVIVVEKQKSYDEIGLEYALATKKILGQNLMGTIQKKGTLEALVFCNSQAMPLTDSMSVKYNAIIKRVSDKNRNPNNKANAEELVYIEQFKKDLAAKIEPKPVVIDKGEKIQFYYPIPTNTMCLECHGKSENIKAEIRVKTLKLYPKDLAIGYGENEVRGIWSITFDNKK